jgi:2-dehydro-3-deoxyphosphooctonate aldolase (KDO 8-P synthase)
MSETPAINFGGHKMGPGHPLVVIAGPCVIESEELCLSVAREVSGICKELDIPYVFKSSYDKANRSSIISERGPGMKHGLEILQKVREEVGVPVLTDVHSPHEAEMTGPFVDVLQTPAFLCRQTDLVLAASMHGKAVNIKKGQFLAPWDAANIIEKAHSTGNKNIAICERGASFGYNNLVVDMKSFPVIRSLGAPVVFDCTHSVQLPGGMGFATAGQREFIEPLARAAVGCGIDALFVETHPEPEKAFSDGTNMLYLSDMPGFLKRISALAKFVRKEFNE